MDRKCKYYSKNICFKREPDFDTSEMSELMKFPHRSLQCNRVKELCWKTDGTLI